MTTNQTERVPDEELDQMIWKLERDGMTPKQLSLMRELQELRKAKCDGRDQFEEWMLKKWGRERQEYDFAMGKFLQGKNYADSYTRHMWKAWSASRAAMQLSGNSEQLEPVSNLDELKKGLAAIRNSGIAIDGEKILAERDALNSPATQNGWIPVSERMPPEGAPLLVCSGNGVVQRTVYGFDGENWLDWYEQYDPVKAEPDDLWQPLPAAPKVVG